MTFSKWVPDELITLLNECEDVIKQNDAWPIERKWPKEWEEYVTETYAMLTRLATRPEMEKFWPDFLEQLQISHDLCLIMFGLAYELNMIITLTENYFFSAKLTVSEYEEEMTEIAELADALSKKMRKFTEGTTHLNNPFKFFRFFTREQFDFFSKLADRNGVLNKHSPLYRFEYAAPPMHRMFENLRDYSMKEASDMKSRLKLPRRVKDKNAFRTFFIQGVAWRFARVYRKNAPSKIATFCSVALDDSDINSDMVRKIFQIPDSDMVYFQSLMPTAKD